MSFHLFPLVHGFGSCLVEQRSSAMTIRENATSAKDGYCHLRIRLMVNLAAPDLFRTSSYSTLEFQPEPSNSKLKLEVQSLNFQGSKNIRELTTGVTGQKAAKKFKKSLEENHSKKFSSNIFWWSSKMPIHGLMNAKSCALIDWTWGELCKSSNLEHKSVLLHKPE